MVNKPPKLSEFSRQRERANPHTQRAMKDDSLPQKLAKSFLLPGCAIVLTWMALWYFRWPLGIPGEWIWWRTPWNEPDRWINLLLGLIAGLAYLAFVLAGARRIDHLSSTTKKLWIGGLLIAALVWNFLVIELAPSAARFGKAPFVLYYPASSGYFTIARHESPQVDQFLKTYPERVQQGDVLHVGTHPPGLFLVFHAISSLVDHLPLMRNLALATMPVSFRDACGIIEENGQNTPHPMTSNDAAILWLATMLVLMMAAGTTLPLYLLCAQYSSPRGAWLTAALWPLVPASLIFIPKSDAAFPWLSTTLLMGIGWLCQVRSTRPAWQFMIVGFLWGILAMISMLQSLAFAPVLLMCFLYGLATTATCYIHRGDHDGWSHIVRNLVAGLAVLSGFLGSTILFSILTGANLWFIWWQNSINHSRFYEVSPRTTWLWFVVSPVELAFAVGWPVFLRFLFSMRFPESSGNEQTLKSRWQRLGQSFAQPTRIADGWRLAACCLSVWLWLWCSGKNSGEAARLWIFLMPILLWVPTLTRADLWTGTAPELPKPESAWWEPTLPAIWLSTQIIICLLTVWRISGFDFGGGLLS